MITVEKSPHNVLSIRLVGTVEKSDITALATAFKAQMAVSDRLGLVVDMSEWSDMTGDAIAEDMKFELGLLGKLSRFPRVAIISDKQFVKAITQFLNPMIPMVKIERFGADQYDKAMAFASELTAITAPVKSTVTLIETDDPKLFAFEIDGLLTKADLERIIPSLQKALEDEGKIDLLARMKNYAGFDPMIFTEASLFSMKLSALNHVRRYAVVGAPNWMKNAAGMFASLLPVEVRFFPADQEAPARNWLKS